MRPPRGNVRAMASGDPFAVHVLRENNYEKLLTVRFEVLDGGMGILGLRKPGRQDPGPAVAMEEPGIDVDHLRAGRFVHVVVAGTRQSYALSRITPEFVEKLPENRWYTLSAVTEYGFRYLVPPEGIADDAQAAVTLQPVKQSAVADSLGDVAKSISAPRPKSVASAAQTGTPAPMGERTHGPPRGISSSVPPASLPPRQTPVAPALAQAVLDGLDLDGARRHLGEEMAKVEALHAYVADLTTALRASEARERDLLDLLSKWQRRG